MASRRRNSVRLAKRGSSVTTFLFGAGMAVQAQAAGDEPNGEGFTRQGSGEASVVQLAQLAPAQGTSDDPGDDDPSGLEHVVVTARRRALENAAVIKRTADTVTDSIVADEAGKLPDTSITEVLQRVPGVVMSRFTNLGAPDQFSFEGTGVQVRGLSGVLGLLNGREVFSANGGSGLNFGDVTPELMKGVTVYKASTANLIEGGIGGTINLQTRMPFDFQDNVANVSASASYGDFSDATTPSASVLLSNRFDTGVGEFGVLVDVAYSSFEASDSFVRVEPYFQNEFNGNTVFAPGGFTYGNDQFERTRKGFYAAVQWRPTDNLEFFHTTFISNYYNEFRSQGVYPIANGIRVVDGEFSPSGVFIRGTIENRVAANGFAPGSGASYTPSDSTTSDFSQGFAYSNERLKVKGTLQVVDSVVDSSKYGFGVGSAGPLREYIDTTGSFPVIRFDDPSPLTRAETAGANNIVWFDIDNDARMYAGDLDAELEIGDGFFREVTAGVRVADRKETDNFVGTGWSASARGWNGVPRPFVSTAPEGDFYLETFPDFFKGKIDAPGSYWFASNSMLQAHQFERVMNTYAACGPDLYYRCANAAQSVHLYGNPSDRNFGLQPSFTETRRDSQGAYVMLRFENKGDSPFANFTGNLGVRWVRNEIESKGNFVFNGGTTYYRTLEDAAASLAQVGGIGNVGAWQAANPGQPLPLTVTSVSSTGDRTESFTYDYFLPSLNVSFTPIEDWVVRFALTRTLTPPVYNDIRATGNASVATMPNPYSTAGVGLPAIFNGYNYSSGNTRLLPELSTNTDVSVEWYPSPSTTMHFALFNKSIKNKIIYNNLDIGAGSIFGSVPPVSSGPGGDTFVDGAVIGAANFNATKTSTVRGAEIGGRTYLNMLPGAFRGLGVETNVTYIDSSAPDSRALDMTGALMPDVPIVGLSEWSYNINLLYDLRKVSARLAYSWRDRYLATTAGNGTTGNYLILGAGTAVNYSLPVYGSDYGQLDGSVNYDINDALQIGLSVTNILDEVSKTEMEILPGESVIRSYFLTDRRVGLSLRGRF